MHGGGTKLWTQTAQTFHGTVNVHIQGAFTTHQTQSVTMEPKALEAMSQSIIGVQTAIECLRALIEKSGAAHAPSIQSNAGDAEVNALKEENAKLQMRIRVLLRTIDEMEANKQ
ncbi:hypothetical protein SeLEV6574_g05113 [Synchytrium endobioticum]|nr:hypothetical protein SeLEV6574_g05113 [Synchytrium endobioticum]